VRFNRKSNENALSNAGLYLRKRERERERNKEREREKKMIKYKKIFKK